MKYVYIFFFLIPLTLQAQTGPACTPEIQFFYDDAGNRIQRKEVCVPNGGGSSRLAGPEIKELVVFPNPGPGIFEMKFSSGLENIRLWVYDTKGQLVMQKSLAEGEHQLDLRDKPAGVYLLKIQATGFEAGRTLIKE